MLWLAVLFCMITLNDHVEFVLFEKAQPDQIVLVAVFLGTSLAFCGQRFRRPTVLSLHLAVAALFLLSHPFPVFFERDGATLLLAAYIATLLARSNTLRAEARLLVGAALIGLLALEFGLATVAGTPGPAWTTLPDYGDLTGSMKPGGMLKPNLDVNVVGETGPVRFVTNELGFRNRAPAARRKQGDEYRVLLIGDSFVAGYRTDQSETIGHLLGVRLSQRVGRNVRVWPALAENPFRYDEYLSQFAFQHEPDLLLIGITLGNDIGSAYATSQGVALETGIVASLELPADAYRTPAALMWLRTHRSLSAWTWYRLVFGLIRPEGIGSWLEDVPTRVHLFDGVHGLGLHYARRELPEIHTAWAATLGYLQSLSETCANHGVPCVVFEIPQRFQATQREWNAALFDYGLDAAAFDPSLASRRFSDVCARAGATCIELLTSLADPEQPTYLPNGDMHWNSNGHSLAATTLMDELMKLDLIDN